MIDRNDGNPRVTILLQKLTLIAAFGALGAVARHLTNVASVRLFGDRFAYGTLAVNVIGCFAIGLLMHAAIHRPHAMSEMAHTAVTTGLLGALTTFSTFSYETLEYLETAGPALAGLNVVANLSLGLLAAWGGGLAGRLFL